MTFLFTVFKLFGARSFGEKCGGRRRVHELSTVRTHEICPLHGTFRRLPFHGRSPEPQLPSPCTSRIQPSLSGVRRSFALGYWLDLASRYKPAMDAYVRVRDETETSFRIEPASFDLFHDVASLNKHIDARERTAKLFAEVAATDPDVARRLYHVAESHLIGIGEYKACGPFLETDKRIALAAKCYHMARQYEDSQPERDTPLPRFSRQHFIENVATLAALLVLNDRDTDAQDVYTKSLLVIVSPPIPPELRAYRGV